jgi:DNA-binding NarL/FixJ family response regulator
VPATPDVDPAIRIAVADDSFLIREAIQQVLARLSRIEVVSRGGSMIDPHMVGLLLGDRRGSALGQLTARERDVLAQMAEGKSNAAIAEALVLTKRAVETHVGAIFVRLGLPDDEVVSRRVAAVLLYLSELDDQRPL